MDADIVLRMLDEDARAKAFKHGISMLDTAPHIDLHALELCVKLWSPLEHTSGSKERLFDLVLLRIPHESLESSHIYHIAVILSMNGPFASTFFKRRLCSDLATLLPALSKDREGDVEEPARLNMRKATAYLILLQCSLWLPSAYDHVVGPSLFPLLASFLGLPDLDEVVLDTLTAFLSLLRREAPVVVAKKSICTPWLDPDTNSEALLTESINYGSFWEHLRRLLPTYYTTGRSSSKIYRIWFQWISFIADTKISLTCLNDHTYWENIRIGLLHGHTDQRKYCIAIIYQSLTASSDDISTPTMYFRLAERDRYLRAYEQYSSLFETIVLDRYANQVQACIPELTKLFKSQITPSMLSTLLSSALNPLVQEGIRKIIGNWYIEYAIQVHGDLSGHTSFLLEGFLPWATTGELFTSKLVSTRYTTACTIGASIVNLITRFISDTPYTSPGNLSISTEITSNERTASGPWAVIVGVLDFILNARGKIFPFAIIYLLEGLIEGLRTCARELPGRYVFTDAELDKICRISRLPGLPEIASDLCSEYCSVLCNYSTEEVRSNVPGYQRLLDRSQTLLAPINSTTPTGLTTASSDSLSLHALRGQLEESRHCLIQGDNYATVCKDLFDILDRTELASINTADLYAILNALWEEADRRQFVRAVAVHVPPVLFHPTCMRVLLRHQSEISAKSGHELDDDLQTLLSKAMKHLQQLSEGRTYILSLLATSIRKAAFSVPELLSILPFEDYIIRFINHLPTTKPEFLFEVAAAEKLQQIHPHRTYSVYYGQREWVAYAAVIDMLQRFPKEHTHIAKSVLDRLLEVWKNQKTGAPIISKWKNVLQLQIMLLLADFCIPKAEVDAYLFSFRHALNLEPWPRYRFLLEWIIARIYYRFPEKTLQITDDLSKLDDNSSTQIASLMKLAVLVAPRESENFSTKFMTQLVPFAASPKVQIRHESNYAIPIIFELAISKGWTRITENEAFVSLNAFIRRLDKFQSAPWTIRTLKLDAIRDFSLVNIFQGQYLTIESSEKDRVAYEDFFTLYKADCAASLTIPSERITLGSPISPQSSAAPSNAKAVVQDPADAGNTSPPSLFQTKSGFSLASLHPLPRFSRQRPSSVILIASLIDNPTNLGGLSRISESFGLEALYIDDLKKVAHKDFKATSVTSEKHFPIRELKVSRVPDFLVEMTRQGYEVVGIEQTDRSGILGTDDEERLGTLPKKCVLVLGSEKGGISAEVLAVVDRCVEIRTMGVTRSLNVQTAGGIALYEWWREWYSTD